MNVSFTSKVHAKPVNLMDEKIFYYIYAIIHDIL